jgi:hypothetical protein
MRDMKHLAGLPTIHHPNRATMMTSRQRLLAVLRGEIPDRVPVAPFVQEEYLSYYYPHKKSVDRVVDATELANELDFDLMAKHRGLEQPHWFRRSRPGWELRHSSTTSDGMERRRLEIVTPHRTFVKEEARPYAGPGSAGGVYMPAKHLLGDRAEIESFFALAPPLEDEDRREMRETVSRWKKILGERGVLAPWGFAGVFNVAAELIGMENLYVAPYVTGHFKTSHRGADQNQPVISMFSRSAPEAQC